MSKYINLISNILDDYLEDGEVKFIGLNNEVNSFYSEDAATKKEEILVKEWDKAANFEGFDTVEEFFALLKEENCLNVLKYFKYILKMNESLNSDPTTTHVFKLLKEIEKEHPELKSLIIDYKGEMGEFGFDDNFYQNVSKEDLLDDLRDYEANLDESYKNKKSSQLNQLKESLGTTKYNKIQSLINECLKEGMEVEITIPKSKCKRLNESLTEEEKNELEIFLKGAEGNFPNKRIPLDYMRTKSKNNSSRVSILINQLGDNDLKVACKELGYKIV